MCGDRIIFTTFVEQQGTEEADYRPPPNLL